MVKPTFTKEMLHSELSPEAKAMQERLRDFAQALEDRRSSMLESLLRTVREWHGLAGVEVVYRQHEDLYLTYVTVDGAAWGDLCIVMDPGAGTVSRGKLSELCPLIQPITIEIRTGLQEPCLWIRVLGAYGRVYYAGYDKGYDDGYDKGRDAGEDW